MLTNLLIFANAQQQGVSFDICNYNFIINLLIAIFEKKKCIFAAL